MSWYGAYSYRQTHAHSEHTCCGMWTNTTRERLIDWTPSAHGMNGWMEVRVNALKAGRTTYKKKKAELVNWKA